MVRMRLAVIALVLLAAGPDTTQVPTGQWYEVTIRFVGRRQGGYLPAPELLLAPPIVRWTQLVPDGDPYSLEGALVAEQYDGGFEETGLLHELTMMDDCWRRVGFAHLELRSDLLGKQATGDGAGRLSVRFRGRAQHAGPNDEPGIVSIRSSGSRATLGHATDTHPTGYEYTGRARVRMRRVDVGSLPFDPAEVVPYEEPSIFPGEG